MTVFKLPDLGEGLPDAIIREWFIKPGDTLQIEQPIAAMETAKALVEVPSPMEGVVEKLHGKIGDTIKTGDPLVSFVGAVETEVSEKDLGTVVGKIAESNVILQESATGIQAQAVIHKQKIIPAYRALAEALNLSIEKIPATGFQGSITTEDFKNALLVHFQTQPQKKNATLFGEQGETLSPAYRAMVQSMTESHANVVPVSLCDDVDIDAWFKKEDITIKLIQAITKAIAKEPRLNAHFFAGNEKFWCRDEINIGIAVDSKKNGLFVPVLKKANTLTEKQIRKKLEEFKEKADSKSFDPSDLKDATIMLSNFGSIAGRYGMPIITPPCVAIIGAGRVNQKVVPVGKKTAVHPVLSLAVTADHRVITGGELARFLHELLSFLSAK